MQNHKTGGVSYSETELLKMQKKMIELQKSMEKLSESARKKEEFDANAVPNKKSFKNKCTTSEDNLKEVFLDDIKTDDIEADTVVWVRTIADACNTSSSVMVCVGDGDRNFIQLYLYDQIPGNTKL